jgi:hypothetical protein
MIDEISALNDLDNQLSKEQRRRQLLEKQHPCETCIYWDKSEMPVRWICNKIDEWLDYPQINIIKKLGCASHNYHLSDVEIITNMKQSTDTFLCCNAIHTDISIKSKMKERALLLEELDKKIYDLQKSRTDGLIPTAWVILAIKELYRGSE